MRTQLAIARKERDQGFTLIEILVVIIIIGVLAAIAIPLYLNQRKKAVDAGLKSDLKNAALIATEIVADGPYSSGVPRPDLGLPFSFNDNSWNVAGPGGNSYGHWTQRGLKSTGENQIYAYGEPADGKWKLCAFNTGASTATTNTAAMLYDPDQGGLQPSSVDCTGWFRIIP